jgi:WD40 repeat protein
VAASDRGAIRRWAAAHAATVPASAAAHPGGAGRAPESPPPTPEPAPTVLASCTEIQSWDPGSGVVESIALANDPAGRPLLASGSTEGVRVWDPLSGELLESPAGYGSEIWMVACGYGTDGRLLLAASDFFGHVILGQPLSGEPPVLFTSQSEELIDVVWGYGVSGQSLLAAGTDDGVRIWDAETGELLRTTFVPGRHRGPVAWGYLADGRSVLAVSGPGMALSVYDSDSGEALPIAPETRAGLTTLCWGYRPDGRPLLVGCSGEAVYVWSERGGEFTASVLTQIGAYSVAWAPLADGRMLLALTTQGALQLWDIHSMSLLHETPIEPGALALDILDWIAAPDGRLLLASAEDAGRIRIWDVVLDPPARWTADPPRSRGDRVRARAAALYVAADDRPSPPVVLASVTETRT